jgi:hypothetical protein
MKSDVFCRLCNKVPSALKNVKLSSDFESILQEIRTHTTSSAIAGAKDDLVVNVIKNHPLRVLQAGVAGYLILSIILFRSSRNTDTHRNSWSKNVFIAGTTFYLLDLLCNISLPNHIHDLGQQQNTIYQQISSLLSHVSSDNIHFLLLTQFLSLSDSSILSPLLSLGPYLVLYIHTILSMVFPTFTRTTRIGKTKGNIRRFDFQMAVGILSVLCNFLNTVLQYIVINLSWITRRQSITQLSPYGLAVEATKALLIMNFSVMKIFSLCYGLWKKNDLDSPSSGEANKKMRKTNVTLEKEPAKKKKKTRKAKPEK